MRSGFAMVLLLGVAGCNYILGIEELSGPDQVTPGDGLVDTQFVEDCKAQRVVHIVAGDGGLAWFTLAWPAPFVITNFQAPFAYDDPGNAANVTSDPAHPLFARRIGPRAIWEGIGQDPHPTVVIAGTNETHTATPQSIVRGSAAELVATGATLQASLAPPLPVLAFVRAQPYGPAPGAPAAVLVNDAEGAISVLREAGAITPEVEQQLRPGAVQLARYGVSAGSAQVVAQLASQLAFTANAFRFGLIGSVIMPAFNDDPHGAFINGLVPQRSTELATMLDAFYGDLQTGSELTCGRGGNALSLADNVVLIVTGDTQKNSFDSNGWPDGTAGNSNLMYVRSNGFTRPGWFGQLQPSLRTTFDPNTGALDAAASTTSNTAAAFAGALYAIARGDKAVVTAITNAPFDGLILR